MKNIAMVVIAVLLAALTVKLNQMTLVAQSLDVASGQIELLPIESVKLLASGEFSLAADLYWMGAIQYFGTESNRLRDYRDLPSYLWMVQGLDPDFCYPYVFSGEAVPYHRPDGKWSNTRAAMELVGAAKGRCLAEWRIPFETGYLLFTFTDRFREAADAVSDAASRPRAPKYLASLATRLYSQQGDLESALTFAQLHLASETNDFARRELQARIGQLELELVLKAVRSAVQSFVAQQGRYPSGFGDLVTSGLLPGVPVDPLGGQLDIGPDGEVHASDEAQLLRLHLSPGGHLQESVVD